MGVVYLAINSENKLLCIKSERTPLRVAYESSVIDKVYPSHRSQKIEINGQHYFTLPYFKGLTLEKAVSKGLSLFEKIRITEQLKDKLNQLHKLGILHRDLKLDNIIYDRIDRDDPIKIIDFGRSVPLKNSDLNIYTNSPFRMLFQPWTAPEFRIRGHIGAHSDLYSYGYCLSRFFPEAYESLHRLRDYDINIRRITYKALNTQLMKHFEREKNFLIKEAQGLLSHCQPGNPKPLNNLITALKDAKPDNLSSINKLQKACSACFQNYEKTSAIHPFLVSILSFLAELGFINKETPLKYKMRLFVQPSMVKTELKSEEICLTRDQTESPLNRI